MDLPPQQGHQHGGGGDRRWWVTWGGWSMWARVWLKWVMWVRVSLLSQCYVGLQYVGKNLGYVGNVIVVT